MHQNSRTKRKEFIYLVDQISLEIVCHHRITVIGRFLGAASLVIILDGPRVILLVAEKLGRIVKHTLIARHTLWLYLRVHPLHKLGSGSIKEHGAITQFYSFNLFSIFAAMSSISRWQKKRLSAPMQMLQGEGPHNPRRTTGSDGDLK